MQNKPPNELNVLHRPASRYLALHWPDSWKNLGQIGRFLIGIPFLGPDYIARKDIELQLRARAEDYIDCWPDDAETAQVLDIISQVLGKRLGWPCGRFIPEDPLDILLWDRGDGFDAVEADLDLSRELSLPNEISFLIWARNGRNLGDIIQLIATRRVHSLRVV